jgi:hypothetical protein
MEYPGVRLGQRGGLYDLYQYYLGGGDQATGDEGPVTTVSMPVTTGGGGGGGAGIDPFAERTARTYLPRDERGFQIQPGSGVFTRQYQPDNFGVDRNIATFGDAGKPILSGFTEEEKDPGRIAAFFDRLKSGIGSINLGNFPTPTTIMSKLGRPADAIYSYGGDASGVGSRAGLTLDEVRNMEYLEAFGGVDEYGRDIYGKNVVSAFGDYEQGVKDDIARIEKTLTEKVRPGATYNAATGLFEGKNADAANKQTKLIRQKLKDYQGFIGQVEDDDEEEEQQIKARNLMTDVDNYLDYTVPSTSSILIPPKKPVDVVKEAGITQESIAQAEAKANKARIEKARANRNMQQQIAQAEAIASSSRGIQSAGNRAPSGGGGGRDSGSAAARGMGGGSRQATSAGSTKSGRSDGGWGWKDGGLVTRKPYGDGGIVDLL